jgi:hypothetical protein
MSKKVFFSILIISPIVLAAIAIHFGIYETDKPENQTKTKASIETSTTNGVEKFEDLAAIETTSTTAPSATKPKYPLPEVDETGYYNMHTLDLCKQYILATGNYPGERSVECNGIKEDDPRLAEDYQEPIEEPWEEPQHNEDSWG